MTGKWSKKWYISIGILLVAVATIGITLALLVSNTNQRANIFEIGDIKMELIEENWEDGSAQISGGRTIPKDPKVVNTGTDNPFYAYLEIQIPKAEVRIVDDSGAIITDPAGPADGMAVRELFTYVVNPEWIELDEYTVIDSSSSYNTYLFGYSEIVKPGEENEALFDEVTFVNIVEGDIPENTRLTIQVNAYAIQSDYLDDMDGLSDIREKLVKAWELYRKEEEGQ